jgi:hypothetical protein
VRSLLLLPLLLVLGVLPTPDHRSMEVAAFGDSLLWEAGDDLRSFSSLRGFDVTVDADGGIALCDRRDRIIEALRRRRTTVVIVAFTGNNLTPCSSDAFGQGQQGSALADAYANDAATVMDAARREVTVLWVKPPVNRVSNPTGAAVWRSVAATVGRYANARLVDGGELLTPDERFSATQPCLWFERCLGPVVDGVRVNEVRSPDGAHLCPRPVTGTRCPTYSSGALRYALAMLGAVVRSVPPVT